MTETPEPLSFYKQKCRFFSQKWLQCSPSKVVVLLVLLQIKIQALLSRTELQPPSTPSRTASLTKHKFGMNWINNRVGCRRCTCGQKIIQPLSIQGYFDRTKGTGKKKVAKVKIDQISRTRDPPVLTHSVTPTLYVITPVTHLLHPIARLLHAHFDLIHTHSELSHGLTTC